MATVTRLGVGGSSIAYAPFVPKGAYATLGDILIATVAVVEVARTLSATEVVRTVSYKE